MPQNSPYQTVQLNISGPSYASRSMPLSAQRSFNLYPEIPVGDGIAPVIMHSWFGATVKSGGSGEAITGCYVFLGSLYAVAGFELRKYSQDLTSFDVIGDINGRIGAKAQFSDNGEVMIIVAGSNAWQYDGTTLSIIPSVDFNPTTIDFLNERFYLNGDDGGTSVSDVLATNFDSGNVFFGRSTPQKTITHYIFNQVVYLFDENSVEPWNDVGTGAPPTQRINQGIIEGIGCKSVYGVTSSEEAMYFIGADSHAYRIRGFSAEQITNTVIGNHFRSLDNVACQVDYVSMSGSKFIIFNFVGDDECWVYCENSAQWFEVGDSDRPYFMVSPVYFNNQWISGDRFNDTIAQLDESSSFNIGDEVTRERVVATVSGEDVQQSGVMLEMSKMRISMETGVSNASGNDVPEMLLIPSFDGGYTWSKPIVLDVGRSGNFTLPIELHMMQQFRRAVFKIRMTKFTKNFTLYSASLDLRVVPF